jgi:hypothetical protein
MKINIRISHKVPRNILTKIACYYLLLQYEHQTLFREFSLTKAPGFYFGTARFYSTGNLTVLTEAFCGFVSFDYVIRCTALN